MAKIMRFEDIQAWQKGRELTRKVYSLTSNNSFSRDFALRDQIRRASISIMLNIAERFARHTDKDFARFLINAHGSAAEVQSALYIALDQGYIDEPCFHESYTLAGECSRMVKAFAKYLGKPRSEHR